MRLDEVGGQRGRAAVPRRERIAEDVPGDHAGLQHARRAVEAAHRAGRLQRVDGVDLPRRQRRHVLADRQLGHGGSARARAFEHGHRERPVLDAGAAGDALALQLRDRRDRAVLGHQELVEHVLRVARVGGDDLEQPRGSDLADARLPAPVPLALPSQRPESIASITCCAPANLIASTSSPASLK